MNTEKQTNATGTPNNPNAGILIYAMQNLGYDNYVAICDIIDNCIDANATEIKIFVTKKNNEFKIFIEDNGHGMTLNDLDEALKFGSNSNHDELVDLGKYGMGLSTAGLSLADKTTVLTKSEDSDKVYKSATDVEIIKQEDAFVKFLGEASIAEKTFFESELEGAESGTIVILENCYGVKNQNVTQFSSKLIKEVARKFRRFMDSIVFYVNDKKITAYDPLMLSSVDKAYESEIYSDDEYEVSWVDRITGETKSGKIHAKLVLLPDTSQSKAKELGINIANQGFSVLRNNREIAFGVMPWYHKHNSRNRVRGEISFDSSMDEAMGVNFTKNNIDMTDSVDHALKAILKPQIASMTSRLSTSAKTSEEEMANHLEAEDAINKKSKVLITPPVKKEKRDSSETGEEKEKKKNISEEEKESRQRTPKKFQGANANVKFETRHCGQSGAIFEAEQQGKTTVIKWNVDHPFYIRFVKENQDNKTLVTSVDFLIYSLAVAQIQAVGEDNDKAIMVDNIISTMSINMKVLLS
ncbi:MAG: ATP-binding protein [Lachnospiraceae bacterium]|nr:ATP-binding protein [Lachnospiraceae bacterium]